MAVAVSGHGGLMVRVDPIGGDRLIDRPDVAAFEMRGRHMRGWLRGLKIPKVRRCPRDSRECQLHRPSDRSR